MNAVALVIGLLILVAVASQVVAFVITLRIRRRSALRRSADDEEGNVLDFSEWKDRIKSEAPPEASAKKLPGE